MLNLQLLPISASKYTVIMPEVAMTGLNWPVYVPQ